LLLALLLFLLPAQYTAPVRETLRRTIFRPFIALHTRLVGTRPRVGDVSKLSAQRDSLVALVTAQAAIAEENRRLRSALSLSRRIGPGFVSAQVLRLGVAGAESTFLLDAGLEQGVSVGSPVIAPEGLVGVVREVDARSAQAIDWTHPEFRASAMTADGEAYGIVEPRPGRYREEDMLLLTGAPFHSEIRPGARILTSGRGELYPRGVPIGTVVGIQDADTGWRKSYLVRPAARPEGLVQVLVAVTPGRGLDVSAAWRTMSEDTLLPPLRITSPDTITVRPDTTGTTGSR
jgi:rod shape-determining protein MreC